MSKGVQDIEVFTREEGMTNAELDCCGSSLEDEGLGGWRECKIGEHISIKHGYAFRGQFITTEETDKILVTPGNFHIGGGFKSTKYKFYNGEVPSEYILSKGSIIVTMTDLSKEGDTLGYSAIVPESKKVYLHNQRIGLVEIITQDVDVNFVYWLFRTRDYHEYILGAATGTSVRHTSPSSISQYKRLIPPLPEQKAIAAVLSSLDDKIDLLHRQNKTLEGMAEALFKQWFVVEAKEEWEKGIIADVVSVKGGTTPSTENPAYWNGSIHWTTPRDLSGHNAVFLSNTERKITELGLSQIGSGLLPKDTVLLSSRAPIGYLAISAMPITINQGYIAIVCDKKVTHHFIYLWCKYYLEEIKNAGNGSTFQEISKSVFKQLPITIPPKAKLDLFNTTVKATFNKIKTSQTQIRTLEKLRDTLLPKLMSGEVRMEY